MKKFNRRQVIAAAGAPAILGSLMTSADAQEKLLDNMRITVGFPPGDFADGIARIFSENLRGKYASNVLVDNKPGAGTRLATQAFIKYRPDGSEALFTAGAPLVLFPHVFKQLPYDSLKDLQPVTRIVNSTFVFGVGPACPPEVKTLADYLVWAKKDPKNGSYATSGAGSGLHLTMEYLSTLTNTPLNMIAYKGASPGAADLVAGQIPAMIASIASLLEYHKAGRVRLLAITGHERHKLTPNLPTFKEQGFPQLTADEWLGFFMPSSTTTAQADHMNRAILQVLREGKVVSQLEGMGLSVTPTPSPAEFRALVMSEHKRWGEIARAVKFEPM